MDHNNYFNDFINITVSVPRGSLNQSDYNGNHQVVPGNDFDSGIYSHEHMVPSPTEIDVMETESFYDNFFGCVKRTPENIGKTPKNIGKTPKTIGKTPENIRNVNNYRLSSTGELKKLKERSKQEFNSMRKHSPWRLIIEEEDILTSSPVLKKPQAAAGLHQKARDQQSFCNFLERTGWKTGIIPGQEYLDDLYEVARSRDDPMLLESLENFLTATVESLLQKQSDNEKLDTALKHATEKNTEIAAQLEEEMESQVVMLEEKIRQEEQIKLDEQKQEASQQILKANRELEDMEQKIVDLEDKISDQAKKDMAIPDHFIDKIRKKEQENQQLNQKLLEFQTHMSLMRTEVAAMKSEYDEQTNRLQSERGTVLSCVEEQENLTRQLQLLHEANKKLHDTNDDLRSALDYKRSSSFIASEHSPVKRSVSCAFQRHPYNDLQSSFRSDPGAIRNSTMNNDLNDTDDDSKQSIPHDEEDINEESLLMELMAAQNKPIPHKRSLMSPSASLHDTSETPTADREHFVQQLEILCATNRRLGESNDELRTALSLLSDQVRSEKSDLLSVRESPQGCYSAPVTPFRDNYDIERPNSTSSPRKVLLTKSGYHSLSVSRSLPDLSIDDNNNKAMVSNDGQSISATTTDDDFSSFCTTCECGSRVNTQGSALCDTCADNDTDAIVDDISLDESVSVTPSSGLTDTRSRHSDHSKNNNINKLDMSIIPDLNESRITGLSGFEPLPKDITEEEKILPIEVQQAEHSLDDMFSELETIPPSICKTCEQERQVTGKGTEYCACTTVDDFAHRSINQSTFLLTESDTDSDNYSEQETSHFILVKRAKPIGSESDQDATYETGDGMTTTGVMTGMTAYGSYLSSDHSRTLLRNLESEMSMYARHQSDEEVDEDDMDDEELIRLVDQTNDESNSLSEEPITVEEKILEPRGYAVGADTSASSTSDSVSVRSVSGEPDQMFKLVLAGNAAVGKSSFIIRLCKNKFYSALNSTLGVDFQMKTLEVDSKNIALQLWDTAGQERFRSIAKSYFRRVDGVVLLYDVTCENSFLDVRDWIESIESSNTRNIPIILCGNKIDLRPQAVKVGMPVITREKGRAYAKEVGALFVETSAKEGTNIYKACKELVRMMQKQEETDERPNGITLEQEKPKKTGCCRS